MSLVGSLEDLGLGEILQIISLSRKSGTLEIRSTEGAGQVVFRDGEIRAARIEGEVTDLAGLLVERDVLDPGAVRELRAQERRSGTPFEVLVASHAVPLERLDELRLEHVQHTVLAMFRWSSGEFSFEVGADSEPPLALAHGLNPQFLALEGARLQDEEGIRLEVAEVDRVQELQAEPKDLEPIAETVAPDAVPDVIRAAAASLPRPAVVVLGRELVVLEKVKEALSVRFERVHIFQRSDLAIGRIRQYLARGEIPSVLLSPDAPPDPLSGARDWRELLARLKAQSSRMPVFVIQGATPEPPGSAPLLDGVLSLSAPGAAQGFASTLEQALGGEEADSLASEPEASEPDLLDEALVRLREASQRLQDPMARSEVLPILMRAASALYGRVAMFMVQEQMLVGMAQIGLPRAGGPDDVGLRGLAVPAHESGWFRRVLESRVGVVAPATDAGDERLAGLLGTGIPSQAYVAPIVSGQRVVAVLYADNLPGDEDLADPGILAPLLVESGLALDRALRARAQAP
jgi:hypothetical protein